MLAGKVSYTALHGQLEEDMKPRAAFAVGLWTGTVIVAAVAWFHYSDWLRPTGDPHPQSAAEQSASDKELEQLRQEHARLLAETQRLKETLDELRHKRTARAAASRPLPASPSSPPSSTTGPWIEQVVVAGDVTALPKLEQLAIQGDATALEALAMMADLDKAESLMHVWGSTKLDAVTLQKTARYLGATIELNPQGKQFLVSLTSRPGTDARLVCAAVDGLVNPDISIRSKPDFGMRARLLEGLHAAVTDAEASACIDKAREELATHVPQTEIPAP